MTVATVRLDTVLAKKDCFVHCSTPDEALDDQEFEPEDRIEINHSFRTAIFIVQNGRHRTVTMRDAHDIIVCGEKKDAWDEDSKLVEP